ncbi:aquaporin [Streptomyces sp. NPDC060223]|uniref:aquaporin n=1 Tax=unclassified Streptomyces TaxID=2593676 RepID=UPI00362A4C19
MFTPVRVSTPVDACLASGGGTDGAWRSPSTGGTGAWASAAAEFALTGGVLFVVVSAVRWMMISPRSRVLPEAHLQLAVVAVIVGTALTWALSSPWGRYSGGHLNPAVTLGLWLTGALHGRGVLPYVAAQLTGSVAGTGLARLVWGPVVGDRMVYAAVKPDAVWPAAAVFADEAAATAATLTVTLVLMSRPRRRRWIPLARSTAVAVVILGTMTGGSANPAPPVWPRIVGTPQRLLVTSVDLPGGTACRSGHHCRGCPVSVTRSWEFFEDCPRTDARKAVGE